MRTEIFINNEFRPADAGRTFHVINPATEEPLAQVARGDAADIDAVVGAARACFESSAWQEIGGRKRGRILRRAAERLRERLDDLAHLEPRQNGKTFFEARIEIGLAAGTLDDSAGWADKIGGETIPVGPPCLVYTRRGPIGSVRWRGSRPASTSPMTKLSRSSTQAPSRRPWTQNSLTSIVHSSFGRLISKRSRATS